jgi:hypothetical protein
MLKQLSEDGEETFTKTRRRPPMILSMTLDGFAPNEEWPAKYRTIRFAFNTFYDL